MTITTETSVAINSEPSSILLECILRKSWKPQILDQLPLPKLNFFDFMLRHGDKSYNFSSLIWKSTPMTQNHYRLSFYEKVERSFGDDCSICDYEYSENGTISQFVEDFLKPHIPQLITEINVLNNTTDPNKILVSTNQHTTILLRDLLFLRIYQHPNNYVPKYKVVSTLKNFGALFSIRNNDGLLFYNSKTDSSIFVNENINLADFAQNFDKLWYVDKSCNVIRHSLHEYRFQFGDKRDDFIFMKAKSDSIHDDFYIEISEKHEKWLWNCFIFLCPLFVSENKSPLQQPMWKKHPNHNFLVRNWGIRSNSISIPGSEKEMNIVFSENLKKDSSQLSRYGPQIQIRGRWYDVSDIKYWSVFCDGDDKVLTFVNKGGGETIACVDVKQAGDYPLHLKDIPFWSDGIQLLNCIEWQDHMGATQLCTDAIIQTGHTSLYMCTENVVTVVREKHTKPIRIFKYDEDLQEYVNCELGSGSELLKINGKLIQINQILYYSRSEKEMTLHLKHSKHSFSVELHQKVAYYFITSFDRWVENDELSVKREEDRVMVYISLMQPFDISQPSSFKIYSKCPAKTMLRELAAAFTMCTKDDNGVLCTIRRTNDSSELVPLSPECSSLCKDLVKPLPFFDTQKTLDNCVNCIHLSSSVTSDTQKVNPNHFIIKVLYSTIMKIWISNDIVEKEIIITDGIKFVLDRMRKDYNTCIRVLEQLTPSLFLKTNNEIKCFNSKGACLTIPTTLIHFSHLKKLFPSAKFETL